jgi:hypothetical protein
MSRTVWENEDNDKIGWGHLKEQPGGEQQRIDNHQEFGRCIGWSQEQQKMM